MNFSQDVLRSIPKECRDKIRERLQQENDPEYHSAARATYREQLKERIKHERTSANYDASFSVP